MEPAFDQGRPRSQAAGSLASGPTCRNLKENLGGRGSPSGAPGSYIRTTSGHQLNGRFPAPWARGPACVCTQVWKPLGQQDGTAGEMGGPETDNSFLGSCCPKEKEKFLLEARRRGRGELGMCVEGRRVEKGLQGD